MKKTNTQNLAIGAILTAFVIVLQILALFTRFGIFAITLVLIPIVIGAAICGIGVSTWLGFVFGLTVLISGDASWFLGFSVIGTVLTVILKGVACGFVTGVVYKLLEKMNSHLAIWIASIICPLVNTGVFALGCYVFFLNDLTAEAGEAGKNVTSYIFLTLIGFNFIIELLINVILNPTIKMLITTLRKQKLGD